MAGITELEIQYQRLLAEAAFYIDAAEKGDPAALAKQKEIQTQIRAVLSQIESIRGSTSSGSIIRDDQDARVQNSNETNPNLGVQYLQNGRITPAPDTTSSSNATRFVPEAINDFGTDDQLRPYIQTQGTPLGANLVSSGPVREDAFSRIRPGGQPGVGAGSDDRGAANATVAELNLVDYGKVTPQPNVLDQYSSYTYNASLYLMDQNSYERMINTKEKNLNGAQLLIQSGGAPVTGRNDYFSLDYYIDSIELKSFVACKGTGLAHNVSDVRMTIIEPNGITLIKNLDLAAEKYLGSVSEKRQRFTQQIYLLVIRFYGYDDQGNLVRGGVNKPNQTSDPNAFIEKWYPLQISNITFKVQSKAVEYTVSAVGVPYFVNASAARGSIPFNIELSGQTLKDILAGPAVYSTGQAAVAAGGNGTTTPSAWVRAGGTETAGGAATGYRLNTGRRTTAAVNQSDAETNRLNAAAAAAAATTPPPKADAALTAKKTIRSGLMAALNEYQLDLVKQKVYDIPDEYQVEFVLDSLASAKVTSTSGLEKSSTSMSTPGTAGDQKLPSKQSMDPNSRVEGAIAGMQIVQFIDTLVRNSSYIKDQQVLKINDNTKKVEPTGVKSQNTSWYKIGFEAIPKIGQGIDKQRNDYAYIMKYTISPYKISQLSSPYFNVPLPTGTHKQYRYWFTGQNDSVLDYTEHFNNLYYSVLSGADISQYSANNISYLKRQYQTASGQASQGATGKTNEPAANAADQLYNPADLAECEITIVGDPAWLQQGEAFAGLRKGDPYYFQPFLADGTINFDSQQILFEVGFNAPDDYNLASGLIEPKWGKEDANVQKYYSTRKEGIAQITRTYFAKEVMSYFTRGKFTQTIRGNMMPYVDEIEQQQQPATKSSEVAAPVNTPAPKFKPPRSSVTNPEPTSSLAKGVQQILNPPTQLNEPTLSQLQSSPVYIQARRGGATPAAALDAARAAFAAGTNNNSGSALPGIRFPGQQIVKDQ